MVVARITVLGNPGWTLRAAPWCSGLTCHPVTVEIEGSNPFGVANTNKEELALLCKRGAQAEEGRKVRSWL